MKEIRVKKNSFNSAEDFYNNCRCICSCDSKESFVDSHSGTFDMAYRNNYEPDAI